MNQDPHAFDGTNASQTNPFTGDLKGEFTSDFGTNTNAVSHIGEGMGGGDNKRTIFYLIGGIALAGILAAALYLGNEDGLDDEDFAQDTQQEDMAPTDTADMAPVTKPVEKAPDTAPVAETKPTEKPAEVPNVTGGTQPNAQVAAAPAPAQAAASPMASTGSITISSPFEGASLPYDETQGPATFSWSGNADRIVFARNSNMAPIVRSRNVTGKQSYRFLHPHPGRWFWRLENHEGGTPPRPFTIAAPVRRNFPITQPQAGAQIAGNGGVVAWQGDSKIARFMVQLVPQGSSWAAPIHQFGTSGTSVALQGVPKGNYDLRVGAFSEVAGRWEWQIVPGVIVP